MDLLTRVKRHFSCEMRKVKWTRLYRDRHYEVGYTGQTQAFALKPLLRQFAIVTTANDDREGKWCAGDVLLFSEPHYNYASRGATRQTCAAFLAELFGTAFAVRCLPHDDTFVVVIADRAAPEAA